MPYIKKTQALAFVAYQSARKCRLIHTDQATQGFILVMSIFVSERTPPLDDDELAAPGSTVRTNVSS